MYVIKYVNREKEKDSRNTENGIKGQIKNWPRDNLDSDIPWLIYHSNTPWRNHKGTVLV